eukprot:TRINITY_DN7535_c0_g1_i2.p3 TRINITY_DN7535_c0_g1~~TRINITY_DN7535_c0_g1_i2.p3  ORF type:complete len:450 (+),score=131.75 TRINITY_DN7535_c0_g1_i2:1714-3063(+)
MPTFLEAVRAKYLPSKDDVVSNEEELIVADEGQKETKKWIMVGMDKLKKKTMQLDKLVNIAVGGEDVDQVGDSAEVTAALPVLKHLDLAGSPFKGWEIPAGITAALPTLVHLDLSQVPLQGALPSPVLSKLKTLILNNTDITWKEICDMSAGGGLQGLEVLHLDSNAMVSLEGTAELPNVSYISFIKNNISNWDGVAHLLETCPVRELVLDSNELQDPSDGICERMVKSNLTALTVSNNKMTSMAWLKVLGTSQKLTSLKLSYPVLPGIAPNHVRLLVIAEVPSLLSLNASSVGTKERGEAEKFYLLRAYGTLPQGTKHSDDCSDLSAEFLATHHYYKEYVKKWHNPSTTQAAGGGASLGGTVEITLRDVTKSDKYKPDMQRSLPVSIKVAQLKAVIKAAYQIPPTEQCLTYKSLEHEIPIPTPLDNDLESLLYYGIAGGKGLIEVCAK